MALLSHGPAQPDPGLLSRALDVAERLAGDATDVITATAGRAGRPEDIDSPFDWVRDTDRTLERHTRRVLAAEFPGIPVVCAVPHGATPGGPTIGGPDGGGYRWLVAPVDGAANYLAGLPWCAYSLALVDAAGPLVGVVADPFRGQIHTAARGRGVRSDGVPVRPAVRRHSAGLLVCTELTDAGPWPGMPALFERARRAGATVRILGSAALSVAQVALGRAAAALLYHYRECEVAGSVAMAVEAGAVVLDTPGATEGGLLVAAPAVAHDVLAWWTGSESGAV